MKIKRYLNLLAVMSVFAACQNETDILDAPLKGAEVTVEAVREGVAGSRTTLTEEYKINWHESDKLSVFLGAGVNQPFTIHKGAGTDYATFKGTGDIFITGGSESSAGAFANVAYYPYSEGVQVSQGTNGAYTITTSLPSNQTYRQGSFGQDAYHMVAVAESNRDYAFTFKNVGSMFMLYLKGSAEITKIELESQANKLAGASTITAAYGEEPSIILDANSAESKITLDCMTEVGEGVTKGVQLNNAESTVFVISVPPIAGDAEDLTFTIYDANYGYMVYKNAAAYSVARNQYYTFGATTAVEYKAAAYTQDYIQDENGNLSIYTAEGMKYFYDQLIAKNTYSGKTVTLMADINMNGVEWVSKTADAYTSFAGTLDGNNKTISNFTATASAEGGYATMFNLFSGEVKNLTLDGVTATDNNKNGRASALVGYMSSGKISGVNVKDATISGYQKVAGLVSYPCDGEIVIENCQIENVTLKASTEGGTLWQSGGLAGYASNYVRMNITGCSVKDITFEGAATAEDCGVLPFYCHPFIGCIDYNKEDTEATVILSNNTVNGTNTETDVYSDANSAYYGYGKHRGTGKLTITIDGKQVWPALVAEVNGTSYETLADAFTAAGENGSVKVLSGTYTIPTSIPNGMTIEGEEGVVFAGISSVAGENVTIKNVVFKNTDNTTSNEYRALTGNLKGTTFEACVFDAQHGARYCYADGTVTFKDCTFGNETCSRGLHFDGGSGNVIVDGCTLYGFNALGESLSKVTFKNCNIKVSSGSTFNGVNMYNVYEYENCTFAPGTHTDCAANNVVATYTNCNYTDKSDITALVRFDKDSSTCTITFDGKAYVTTSESLGTALQDGGEVVLSEGEYTLPAVSNSQVAISGTKETEITISTPNYSGSDVTLTGVTVKGSGYATGIQHVNTVTYNDVTIEGEMCLYGEKVVFNGCTFELNGQYIWTYGAKVVEFKDCIFNTTGKAILIYNEGAGASEVTVTGCTFNATAGATAGAIANQNCAAIEIDNFQSSGTGTNHTLITNGNTYNEKFSGEWRIKNYVSGGMVTVNGKEYTSIAIDGKTMTIDADKNVTVND